MKQSGEGKEVVERRKNGGLTDEQVEAIKDAILASLYEEIGRSLVKKALWAFGILGALLIAWSAGKERLFLRFLDP